MRPASRWRTTRASVLVVLACGAACWSAAEDATRLLEGTITREDHEGVLELPFDVPLGTRGLTLDLDQDGKAAHTVLDLGLRGPDGLRGWSGGALTHIWLGPLSAAPGYLPGAVDAGRWHVLLGVANIRPGVTTRYRLEVRLLADPPLLHPTLRQEARWYAGDLHSHSGHSDGHNRSSTGRDVPGPVHRVLDAAVKAGLDFLALSDHNTASHWLDIDRLQPYYDTLLLLHAREITTYHGHANAFGESSFGEFQPRGDVAGLLERWSSGRTFLSINHPLRASGEACMGCGWEDRATATLAKVQGAEVRNGAVDHWRFWADALNAGLRLTAVGGSDEHRPDDDQDGTRLGAPTTMVFARALAEDAIVEGLRAGRVYVLTRGGRTPELEFRVMRGAAELSMGDACTVAAAEQVTLRAAIRGARGQRLIWIRNGEPLPPPEEIGNDSAEIDRATTAKPGDWFSLRIEDPAGDAILLSNAVYFLRATR